MNELKKEIASTSDLSKQQKAFVNSKTRHLKLSSQITKEKEWKSVKKASVIYRISSREGIYTLWEFQKEKRWEKGQKEYLKEIKAEISPNLEEMQSTFMKLFFYKRSKKARKKWEWDEWVAWLSSCTEHFSLQLADSQKGPLTGVILHFSA